MNVMDVYDAISTGEVDDHIDEIFDALHARRKAVAAQRALSFKNGDRVRLVNIKPKYLAGLEGVITGKVNSRFVVQLDDPASAGRYVRDGGDTLDAQAAILEPVNG